MFEFVETVLPKSAARGIRSLGTGATLQAIDEKKKDRDRVIAEIDALGTRLQANREQAPRRHPSYHPHIVRAG